MVSTGTHRNDDKKLKAYGSKFISQEKLILSKSCFDNTNIQFQGMLSFSSKADSAVSCIF